MGHNVLSCGLVSGLDLRLEVPLIHIDTVISMLPDKFSPDVIVWHDNSSPIMFSGLEESPIPSLIYSVDTHHHAALHSYLYHIFEHMLIAHKDYIPLLQESGCQAQWLPLWASRMLEPSQEKRYQAVFVGTLNPALNPSRVSFFEKLSKIAPVDVQSGDFGTIFPYSEIVINQTVKGDLNFRVFEAMISGAMLLTEESGNGLTDLFEVGQHLLTYSKDDAEQAATIIAECLSQPARMRAIASAGRQEILEKHLAIHRAVVIECLLHDLKKQNKPLKYFAAMLNYAVLANSFERIDRGMACRALVFALKAASLALARGEPVNQELASYAVLACMKYDLFLNSSAGTDLLQQFQEAYPDQQVLLLHRIRRHLNRGELAQAKRLAIQLADGTVTERDIFQMAEQIMTNLLAEFDQSGRFRLTFGSAEAGQADGSEQRATT